MQKAVNGLKPCDKKFVQGTLQRNGSQTVW